MIKCSANYCKSNNNFVIIGIDENKDAKVDYSQTIKIVKNIINRGAPTLMSKFLREKIQYDLKNDNDEYKLISSDELVWDRTIKGYDEGMDYTAREFYNEIFEKYLGEYSFVKKLILPEARFLYLLNKDLGNIEYENKYQDSSVDFFIPQVDLVIEIDGAQHKESRNSDKERDKILLNNGKTIKRIKVKDIKEENDNLKKQMKELKEMLSRSSVISNYKDVLNGIQKKNIIKEKLIKIVRLQIVILELLKNGYLRFDKDWNISLQGIENDIALLAIDDLKYWFDIIFKLQKIHVDLPKFNIVDSGVNVINIDNDIYKRYDDTCLEDNVIYVRNDYFENEKNYYQVECDDSYRYSLDYNNKKDRDNLIEVLKNLFGFTSFRDGQERIIMELLNLKDTIGVLPTGSGKSLCYQLSSLLQPGISFIIAPLKSLIIDQKESMDNIFINNTAKIDSTMKADDKSDIEQKIRLAKYQMIWISPERFQMEDFRYSIDVVNKKYSISYAVIDEVHCLSEWGHDFRTSYLHLIKTIREYMSGAVLVGLTATASDKVLKDLKIEFELPKEYSPVTTCDFIRHELNFYIYYDENNNSYDNKKNNLEKILLLENKGKELKESGIIFDLFSNNYRGAKQLSDDLVNFYNTIFKTSEDYKLIDKILEDHKLIDEISYFVGTDNGSNNKQNDNMKLKNQKKFKNDEIKLLVATKAFGMGIDKPNIRYIVNYFLPSSFEELYQEDGRAGRDGKDSNCYIMHSRSKLTDNEKKILFGVSSSNKEIKKLVDIDRGTTWEKSDVYDNMNLLMLNKDDNEDNSICDVYKKFLKPPFNTQNEYGFKITKYDIIKEYKDNIAKAIAEVIDKNSPKEYEDSIAKAIVEVIDKDSQKEYKDSMVKAIAEVIAHDYKSTGYEWIIANAIKKEISKIKNSIESSIYKLSLIGLVKDWTINYKEEVLSGTASILNKEEMFGNLEKYIKKYQPDFSFDTLDNVIDKEILDILNDKNESKDFRKCVRILCKWYDETILYERRRAIEYLDNVFEKLEEKCKDKAKTYDISKFVKDNVEKDEALKRIIEKPITLIECTKEFNEEVERYFGIENYDLFTEAAEGKIDYLKKSLEKLKTKNKDELEKIKTNLDKLLVTNRLNIFLNLLVGLARIKLNIVDVVHDEEFEYALDRIDKSEEREIKYKMILDTAKTMDKEMIDKLNGKLEKYFNSKDDYILNYKYLKTDKVLKKIIEKENIRIHSIEGDAINGSRKNGSVN